MTEKIEIKQPKAKKRKRRSSSLEKKKARSGWIFVLPFVIGFLLIYLPIVINSIQYSFGVWDTATEEYTFEGFKYYIEVFTADFKGTVFLKDILLPGIGELCLDIPMILMFSLFMAVLLNQKLVGRAAFRAILFVPVILSTGIMDTIEASSAGYENYVNSGLNMGGSEEASEGEQFIGMADLMWLFEGMGGGALAPMLSFVVDAINSIFDIVSRSGVQILIFLAGLQSISPAIYESVQIDGATAWETFWKITFPMISPMILVNAVYTVIDAFTGTNRVMDFITTSKNEFSDGLAVSSAMQWVYFLVVIAILALVVGVMSSYVFYQKKK